MGAEGWTLASQPARPPCPPLAGGAVLGVLWLSPSPDKGRAGEGFGGVGLRGGGVPLADLGVAEAVDGLVTPHGAGGGFGAGVGGADFEDLGVDGESACQVLEQLGFAAVVFGQVVIKKTSMIILVKLVCWSLP